MVRTVFACSVVVLVAATVGCRMCAHPYDDCRPTFTGECGEACCPNARECSILSADSEPVQYEMEATPEMEPTPDPEMELGRVPAAEQLTGFTPGVEEPVRRIDTALWDPLAGRPPHRIRWR